MYYVPFYVWILTGVWFFGLLAGELYLSRSHQGPISLRSAIIKSLIWIALGLAFGVFIWFYLGSKAGAEYYAGYFIEKSLSIDNIFVWSALLAYLKISRSLQYTVLFWGIIGAIVFRTLFMILGSIVIHKFQFVLIILGIVLLYTSYKLFFDSHERFNPNKSRIFHLVKKYVPFTEEIHGTKLFIRKNGKKVGTYLFFTVCIIELTDILFAIDSVPTVLAIVRDPYVALTSNIAALLGLRALYFVFDGLKYSFWMLNKGLAIILGIVGISLFLEPETLFGLDWVGYKIPINVLLPTIFAIITASIIGSLIIKKPRRELL